LARHRAKRRGETVTEAILSSLKESERMAMAGRRVVTAGEILKLAEDIRKLAVLSVRSEDDILGYDKHGIPAQ
jgi:hypothetical protein